MTLKATVTLGGSVVKDADVTQAVNEIVEGDLQFAKLIQNVEDFDLIR